MNLAFAVTTVSVVVGVFVGFAAYSAQRLRAERIAVARLREFLRPLGKPRPSVRWSRTPALCAPNQPARTREGDRVH